MNSKTSLFDVLFYLSVFKYILLQLWSSVKRLVQKMIYIWELQLAQQPESLYHGLPAG